MQIAKLTLKGKRCHMDGVKTFLKQGIARVRFWSSTFPSNSLISLKAEVKRSQFEGANTVGPRSRILYSELGYGSYVSNDSELLTTRVGRYCSLGPNIKMPTGQHPMTGFASTSPMFYSKSGVGGLSLVTEDKFDERKYASGSFSRVIGNDVWIGGDVVILEGVTIGDGAIIGAGALVSKDIPPYAICTGAPAKVRRYRFDSDQIESLLKLRWWERDVCWLKDHADLFEDVVQLISYCETL